VGETGYLQHALGYLKDFFNAQKLTGNSLIFIPYAGVSISYDRYEQMVNSAFSQIGLNLRSLHHFDDKVKAIQSSSGIVVGGGNTFALLNALYQYNLVDLIKVQVDQGTPYVGWSAGSNIATPSIKTTNDMPIVEPPSFNALNLIPWQINPHYLDVNPPGHNGETRQQRIEEFLLANPNQQVIGLPEGTGLLVNKKSISYLGSCCGYLFNRNGKSEFTTSQSLNKHLNEND